MAYKNSFYDYLKTYHKDKKTKVIIPHLVLFPLNWYVIYISSSIFYFTVILQVYIILKFLDLHKKNYYEWKFTNEVKNRIKNE